MKTIFIVEPDNILQSSYVGALNSPDRQIYSFRTANLAVRALEKVIPDIVILELALPVHNGFEFLYELRSYADTRDVKVIVNSFVHESAIPWGYVNRGDLGIRSYLHKPFVSLDDIIKAVNDI